MMPFPPTNVVAAFAGEVLQRDLPGLPAERRLLAAEFVGGRVLGMPTPLRVGVGLVAIAVAGGGALVGRGRMAVAVGATSLPVIGEYARLVRSLGYAYVWERWPETAPDGSPGNEESP